MAHLTLIALLLTGCTLDAGDLPRVTPEHYDHDTRVAELYPDETAEALAVWRQHFPLPSACSPDDVYVAFEQEERCIQDGKPDGCLLEHKSVLWGDSWTIAVLDEDRAAEVVARELRRWLAICSGVTR